MIVLLKLLLAHLAGDFILQPDGWVRDKEAKKHRSAKLYLHVLLHGLLAWVLIWDPNFWPWVIAIVVSHFAMDLTKILFQKNENKVFWFVADQFMHVLVIVLIWYQWQQPQINPDSFSPRNFFIILTAAVFLTTPCSVIIKTVISQWTPDTFYTVSSSLPDAGKFIGYLERLLVLLFILYNHWEAVGFLLAAKSVFRFGNLKESHDRKLTEYVLIGTLLSFALALVVSLIAAAAVRSAAV